MRSFPIFAALFLIIPILEIWLLVQVGSVIGAGWTILLVIFTAVLGGWMLRQQGLSTLQRFQHNMGQGQLPATEMLEGVALLVGGALLMTPGFFTDAVGFICLFPVTRRLLLGRLFQQAKVHVQARSVHFTQGGFQQHQPPHSQHSGRDLEGEVVGRRDDDSPKY